MNPNIVSPTIMTRRTLPAVLPAVLIVLGLASMARAQPGETAVEAEPLQCWAHTTSGAVRQGEVFSLMLTCAVVETDAIKVVPDQAPLDPSVIQMPPFEVIGGTHAVDLHRNDHRYFQYEYQLRVISEDLFGKDVKLPDTKLSYRVQTRANGGAAIEGREQTYFLPPLFVKVLSIVPTEANDIRDAAHETFGVVEARQFQANTLRTVGGVLFALAALMAVLALARLLSRYRTTGTSTEQLIGDSVVLGSVRRELSSIRSARQAAGWTPDLIGRLATALRIVAGYAMPSPAVQVAAASGSRQHDGSLFVRAGWTRGRTAAVSSSVTTYRLAQQRAILSSGSAADQSRAALIEGLEQGISHVTGMRYGKDDVLNETSLDEAVDAGISATRRLQMAYTWPAKKLAAMGRFKAELGQRMWAR